MRASVLPALILCWLASQSAAELDCATVNALSRLHAGKPILERAANATDPNAALGPLRRDMRRLDGDIVTFSGQTVLSSQERNALRDLADIANRFSALADRNETAALRALINSDRTTDVFFSATNVLARVACPKVELGDNGGSTVISGPSSGSNQTIRSEDQPGLTDGLNIVQAAGLLALGALLAAVMTTLFWLRKRHTERQRRRAQRYPLNRPVGYYYLGENHDGRLLDISAVGTKLSHEGTLKGGTKAKVTVVLAGWPQDALIVWANDHFAGLQFLKPLSRSRLHSFIALGNDTPEQKQKAA